MNEEVSAEFARIYDAYRGRVVACAARLIGRSDAEDVAEEVFIKVGRSLETLIDPGKLSSWIYSITLNTVRDLIRARSSRPEVSTAQPESDAASGEGERTPEEIAIRNEMIACYLDYVGQLPPAAYEVYVLSEFEDLSNDQIARRLGLRLSTVKMRLHRARATLNTALRANCRCYRDAHGRLMGDRKPT